MTPEELAAAIDARAQARATTEVARLFAAFAGLSADLQRRPSSLRQGSGVVSVGEALAALQADIETAVLPGIRADLRAAARTKFQQILDGL